MGYNRLKNNMKKYLYLLIACTMMCFAGCEEKGDEIDNTTDTGESVEINEADLVGTWEFVSCVDSSFNEKGEFNYYYVILFEYDSDKNKWRAYETKDNNDGTFCDLDKFKLSLTLNADKTYSANSKDERWTSIYVPEKTYSEETGNWSVSKEGGLALSMQKSYLRIDKEDGTVEEYTTTREQWLKYNFEEEEDEEEDIYALFEGWEYINLEFLYPEILAEYYNYYDEEWGIQMKYTSSITELTDTRLVIELKMSEETRKFFKDSEYGPSFSITSVFKKVK